MRTKGFICIVLGFAAVSLAGQPGYLPEVGPLPLRFQRSQPPTQAEVLPPILATTPHQDPSTSPEVVEIPITAPDPFAANSTSLMQNPPVTIPDVTSGVATNLLGPLIGPLVETNGVVSPQMFLRFFVPPQGGVSKEAVLVVPPGFSPAQPPARSSTATYSTPQ
jgi:hypothetical protein